MNLVSIDTLIPASYNPRKVDPDRLELVALSLRKLGWLLPVYAMRSGEILSGHQRTYVARQIGYREVPVVYVDDMDENTRKAVNVLFNASTNDMERSSTTRAMYDRLRSVDLKAFEDLPDKMNHYPCIMAQVEEIAPLLKINAGRWNNYATSISRQLVRYKILMPVVVDPAGMVVNGIGRLRLIAEKKATHAEVVRISYREADFARLMLNLLSMDFDIAGKYADFLRHNSFRRALRHRSYLGRGFIFALIGGRKAETFDITKQLHRDEWVKRFGLSVVDFGAGHLTETELLRGAGVKVTPFEPYHTVRNKIDKEKSLALAREFLQDVRDGVEFSSIFISSVLNSVPFEEDRRHIVQITSALCGPDTITYAVASSDNQTEWTNRHKDYLNEKSAGISKLTADYEENVQIGEVGIAPKVQKYHSPEMFYKLFKTAYRTVQVNYDMLVNVSAIAAGPCWTPEALAAALKFEFDLPYPDGTRMGMVEEAVAAFEERLKIKLPC